MRLALAFFLILSLGAQADTTKEPAKPAPLKFSEPMLPAAGLAIGCMIAGLPTCMALFRPKEVYNRPWRQQEVKASYFPTHLGGRDSYSDDYSRFEASAYKGSALVDLSHRQGGDFHSTSTRVAYSFDLRKDQETNEKVDAQPALGLGYRANHASPATDAIELWLPIFFHWRPKEKITGHFETLWVFHRHDAKLEGQLRLGYKLADNAALELGGAYFRDNQKPGWEIFGGPTVAF
jgi:hypothetical protein